jgi:hypothetical protein
MTDAGSAGSQSVSQIRVVEAGDSSAAQKERNVHCWMLLPGRAVKTVCDGELASAVTHCC